MADSLKDMGPEQPTVCLICGQPIRWSEQSAFYSTMRKTSMHNACMVKYGIVKRAA